MAKTPSRQPTNDNDENQRLGLAEQGSITCGRPPTPISEKRRRLESPIDPYLVTWDSPKDSYNPRNWSNREKWKTTIIVSAFAFFNPVSSSIVAPALDDISREFLITNNVRRYLILSIFNLGYAFGPLIYSPLSEVYGRVPVLQFSNLFYLTFNIACGVCRSEVQLLVFRFLSGIGVAAPLALGNGILADCFEAEDRAHAVAVVSLAPLLGPALGPILGGFITQNTTWRWMFYATSIASVTLGMIGLFCLRESWGPRVLQLRAIAMRKSSRGSEPFHTEYDANELVPLLKRSCSRPFVMLGTQPIVQLLSAYMAYLFGIMYLLLAYFPRLWEDMYGEAVEMAGLNYISLALGLILGTYVTSFSNAYIYRRLQKQSDDVVLPEHRVPMMFVGSVLPPVGLLWYGWSAQARLHWVMPNIGALLFTAGAVTNFACIRLYLADAYTTFAASALASALVLRNLTAFGFPLFAPHMYGSLGYGWGNTLLALVAVVIGGPVPFVLWRYGAKIRARSGFVHGI